MIEKPSKAKDRIILALDVDNLKEAEDLVRELKDYVGYFKIGLPLIVNLELKRFDFYKSTVQSAITMANSMTFHTVYKRLALIL